MGRQVRIRFLASIFESDCNWIGEAAENCYSVDSYAAEAPFVQLMDRLSGNTTVDGGLPWVMNSDRREDMRRPFTLTNRQRRPAGPPEYWRPVPQDDATRKSDPIFSKATQLNPNNANAHLLLGLSYRALKRSDQARVHFEKTLQLEPNHPQSAQIKQWLGQTRK